MSKSRRWLMAASTCLFAAGIAPAMAAGTLNVVYAGSMGVVMDRGLSPAFTASTGTQVQGMGEAAMGLAHLLAAKSVTADVFVSVSAAPIKIVEAAGLTDVAVPVASTSMVLTYSPTSKFASAFAASEKTGDWAKVLATPGLRFGRTDPSVDPQGQYVLYALQLTGLYYKMPGFQEKIAGPVHNPEQIFAEPSLLARLQEGQIDATLGYESAVISQHMPFITLPDEINFSNPAFDKTWYSKASLSLPVKGVAKTMHPSPLVYYASVMKNAKNPKAAQAFVNFLNSPQGQKIFAQYGYNPGKGGNI